jgi:hypothetical protein
MNADCAIKPEGLKNEGLRLYALRSSTLHAIYGATWTLPQLKLQLEHLGR